MLNRTRNAFVLAIVAGLLIVSLFVKIPLNVCV